MADQSSPVSLSEAAQQNVRTILELERKAHAQKSWSEALSERISAFAGSLTFILVQLAVFVAWALWNAVASVELQFDPYPYGLLAGGRVTGRAAHCHVRAHRTEPDESAR